MVSAFLLCVDIMFWVLPSSLPVSQPSPQSSSRLRHPQFIRSGTCVTASLCRQPFCRSEEAAIKVVFSCISQRTRFSSHRSEMTPVGHCKKDQHSYSRLHGILPACRRHHFIMGLRLSYSSSQDAAWIHLSSLMCIAKPAASKPYLHAPRLQSVTLANPG